VSTRQDLRAVGRYGTVGIELVLSIAIGYLGGHWIDGKVGGGRGWITLAGVVVGFYAGCRAVWKAAKSAQRDMERLDREEAEERQRYLSRAKRGQAKSAEDDEDGPR
jgi:F0F1-type ATP synthase assembly protein I